MKTECCVCKMQRDEHGKYYTPTEHQRREYYFIEKGKLSHTYCPICSELQRLSEEGLIKVIGNKTK